MPGIKQANAELFKIFNVPRNQRHAVAVRRRGYHGIINGASIGSMQRRTIERSLSIKRQNTISEFCYYR